MATIATMNEVVQGEMDYTISDKFAPSNDCDNVNVYFDDEPETIDPNTISAFELRRQAARRVPIPDFVIDETVRNY